MSQFQYPRTPEQHCLHPRVDSTNPRSSIRPYPIPTLSVERKQPTSHHPHLPPLVGTLAHTPTYTYLLAQVTALRKTDQGPSTTVVPPLAPFTGSTIHTTRRSHPTHTNDVNFGELPTLKRTANRGLGTTRTQRACPSSGGGESSTGQEARLVHDQAYSSQKAKGS